MSAEHRRRGFWGAIFDDRYRKLVAVGLAVLLWWFIDERITDSWTVPMPLVHGDREKLQSMDRISNRLAVLLPPGERVVGKHFFDGENKIKGVQVTLSGPRYSIDDLREQERLQLEVMTFVDRAWRSAAGAEGGSQRENDIVVVEFTAANISRGIRRDDVVIEMNPPRVRLEVEIRDNLTVVVNANNVEFVTHGYKNRLRMNQATFRPPQMKLVGPSIAIRKLANVKTLFRAEFLNVQPGDTEVSAQLTIIDGPNQSIYPEDEAMVTTVTIPLEPDRKLYTLTLPVAIRDLRDKPIGAYETVERTLAVEVSFAGRLGIEVKSMPDAAAVQAWAESHFRLEVYIEEGNNPDEFSPQLFLMPIGKILKNPNYKHSDYNLETERAVTLRKKK